MPQASRRRHEPLVDVGGLEGFDDRRHRDLAAPGDPHPGPLPTTQVGQGEDGAGAGLAGRDDLVPPVDR